MGCADSKAAGLGYGKTITVTPASNNRNGQQTGNCSNSAAPTHGEGHHSPKITDEEDAAVKIQAFYRGYQTRRELKEKELQASGQSANPKPRKKKAHPAPQPPVQPQPQPVQPAQPPQQPPQPSAPPLDPTLPPPPGTVTST